MLPPTLGWISIIRLGAVQMALGSIVVLMTSTLNRVMVIELSLPSTIPGLLIALHYAIQVLRPRWGYGADVGGRSTPWIVGGMAVLAAGGTGAAVATALFPVSFTFGLVLAIASFTAIGAGAGACGTSVLVLMSKRVAPERRAPAATIIWIMMIAGFIVTSAVCGHYLDPFSTGKLIAATACVAITGMVVTLLAVWGLEPATGPRAANRASEPGAAKPDFTAALAEVWREPEARRFAIFVFVSMLAYSAEEMVIEPYAGIVFALPPGATTKLAAYQHGGVLAGMVLTGLLGSLIAKGRPELLRGWAAFGCLFSAGVIYALAAATALGIDFPLQAAVFVLGMANGTFAIAAISSMMAMVASGRQQREGTRMGLWGAAQGIAFGLGGLASTVSVDLLRAFAVPLAATYALVFGGIGCLFVVSAVLALSINRGTVSQPSENSSACPQAATPRALVA